MRYQLDDQDLAPERVLVSPRYDHTLADVANLVPPAADVLRDFVEGIQPHHLAQLAELAASGAGFGHEIASSTYDDDVDSDVVPFEGVLITAEFRPDEVVMSRHAYARLVDALATRSPKAT